MLADGARLGIWDVAKAALSAGLLFVMAARLRSWALASRGRTALQIAGTAGAFHRLHRGFPLSSTDHRTVHGHTFGHSTQPGDQKFLSATACKRKEPQSRCGGLHAQNDRAAQRHGERWNLLGRDEIYGLNT